MKLVRRKSDCVVALSKGVEEDLIDNCGVPKEIVTTIYNPCDGELLREKAKNTQAMRVKWRNIALAPWDD